MSPPAAAPRLARLNPLRSLKGRLVALFLLLALATTVVFILGSRQSVREGWKDYGRPLASDYVDRLVQEIGQPPSIERAQALVQHLPIAVRIDGPVVRWQSHPGLHFGPPPGAEGPDRGRPGEGMRGLMRRRTADGHWISFRLARGEADAGPDRIGWLTLAGLLGLTGLAYAAVWRMLRPLDDIRAGVARYGEGRFDAPIPVRKADELGRLAQQVNGMAGNLSRMLEGQRGLLLAISHELRSPLTRARLHAELLADGPERDALLRDLGLMRTLIQDLLESERLAAGPAALQRQRSDLPALVREALESSFPDGPWTFDSAAGDTPVAVDRARWQLLVRNLVDNALRHGAAPAPAPSAAALPAEPPVEVRLTGLDAQGEPLAPGAGGRPVTLMLTVRDHGPGLPPEQRQRLAQPFYRPDAARSRSSGGVGLGLYLCRLVAESHGGTLSFADAGPGLRVEVRLPVDEPAAAQASAASGHRPA